LGGCKIKKEVYILLFLVAFFFSLGFSEATTFEINGTVYDINGNPLNNSNVSVLLKDNTWSDQGTNYTTTNASGWFNFSVTSNSSYFYQLTIFHINSTYNHVDWVGQALPSFPYQEMARVGGNLRFYLDQAGTINITVRNQSNTQIQFSAQVKDVQLGYPVTCTGSGGSTIFTCYVPKDRNYSIMVYPSQSDPGQNHFVPLSFNWNNFSSTSSYNILDNNGAALSSYNATTSRLDKQFNCTMAFSRVTGYLNNTLIGNYQSWTNITIVPYLTEPGNMIFASYGTLPYNMSAWRDQGDVYNKSTGIPNATGWFNVTMPYAPAEETNFIFFASANNGSNYFGSYRNITISSANHNLNMTLYGLLGDAGNINLTYPTSSDTYAVATKKQRFNLVNSTTNETLSGLSAHIETKLDYTNYGMGPVFTFMEDINSNSVSQFFVPMLNVSGVKEINLYTMDMAPKRVPTKSATQIISNPNITLSSFNPGDIEDEIDASDISVGIYKSNSSCDVPVPSASCLLTSTATMDSFNPLAAIIGGGDVSFRVTMDGVTVHYVNVDLFASGPPDAMFDDDSTSAEETTSSSFSKALRFGSQGPTIYSYILIAIPYTEGSSSTTGLNENVDTNMSIPIFYDENWNVVWNTTLNGTSGSALAGNDSHYSTYADQWSTLMSSTNCTTTVSELSASTPCYKDKTNNKIWIRLPHFSGNSPEITGGVVTASTSTTTTTTGGRSSGEGRRSTATNESDEEEIVYSAPSTSYAVAPLLSDQLFFELGFSEVYEFEFLSSSGFEESHSLTINELTSTSATFTIASTPQTFTLSLNEFVLVDLDLDGVDDIRVSLISIIDNKANFEIENVVAQEVTEEPVLEKDTSIWIWIMLLLIVLFICFAIFVLYRNR